MRHRLILLGLIGLLGLHLPAQSLQVEFAASGGGNWSWGPRAEGFKQSPYRTFSLQAGLGWAFSPRWGVGAGVAYFESGVRTAFSLTEGDGLGDWWVELVNTYPLSPRVYAWYSFAERPGWLNRAQVQMGLRYARSNYVFDWPGTIDAPLPGGQTLQVRQLNATVPHHLWAIEAAWTYRWLRLRGHGVFVGLHLMKGLTPIMTTTHTYAVLPGGSPQASRLTLQGDFVGIMLAYR
ncbi:MAG: hypothetical protein D6722_08280 [Bacteroidetes bacterium]|nr:MAG: hypothetical protein D6722_08280 [Bacteroidota bacterium]